MAHRRNAFVIAVALVAVALVATPASAYTIYLKDGSTIVAAKKYEISGDNAIITLPNGTQTSIQVSEIDVPRTEQANTADYGDALVVEGGQVTNQPPPTRQEEDEPTLADVATRRPLSERLGRQPENQQAGARAGQGASPSAGTVDMMRMQRQPYTDVDVGSQISTLLRSRGIEDVALYKGTRPDRVFLEFTTNSEASVFRSLEASANVFVEIHQQFPQEVAAFEVFMATDRRTRAGQFLITPERAAQLASRQMDPSEFFLRYVEF